MNARPAIDPEVLATLAEAAPDRLRRKLDKNPKLAEEWDWSQEGETWQIDAGNERVLLETSDGRIRAPEQVRCSCLLSPRCLHVLSVLSVLELMQDGLAEPTPADDEIIAAAVASVPQEWTEIQTGAARAMWKCAASLLASGARASGTLLQARLLRAIHECRNQGLHRLAAGGLRVIQNIRLLREESDAFKSEDLRDDFSELLRIAWRIMQRETPPNRELLGVARRDYQPIGSLRLTGLFTEPILTRSGYAGVVTYLLSDDRDLYSVSNVRPGEAGRISEAYQTGAEIGGLSMSHQALSRQSLLLQKATRSADGRLGGGEDCRAVATESLGWNSEAAVRRFQQPLAQQVQKIFERESLPENDRPAGWDFLFLDGTFLGSDGESLILDPANGQSPIRLKIADDHSALPYRENLELLARVPGSAVRCLARMLPSSPGDALALAIAPLDTFEQSPNWQLPDSWGGHGNLGIDRFERGLFQKAERRPFMISPALQDPPAHDGLEFMRRRLEAVALGGRHAIPTGRVGTAVWESRRLGTNLQPAAAALLKGLAQSAIETQTDVLGQRFPPNPTHLAERWLAGAVYEETARRHFQKWNWLRRVGV